MILPEVVDTRARAAAETAAYANHPLAAVDGHVVRMSVMTGPYPWHLHPNGDETFLVLEGRLEIAFEAGVRALGPGEMLTVPRGLPHATRPLGDRSVNLTVERADLETVHVAR